MARKMSPEHLAKLQAGRKAAQEKKKLNEEIIASKTEAQGIYSPGTESEKAQQIDPTQLLLQRLMAEIDELKKQRNPTLTEDQRVDASLDRTAELQGVTIGANGVQGKKFRYPVEPSYYPNPVERLYDEPTLSRFNLRENYFFTWEVTGVEYEKYGITYAEPKFTVRLFRRMFDDDGQETGEMALINTQVQHEDEVVARSAADKLGLAEAFPDFRDMMSEVRYYRIRTWLLALFQKPKVEQHRRQARPQVIDGKVVEMYDTETLIDGGDGISKASTLSSSARY